LVTDKRIVDSLIIPESVEKTFQIDEHIGASASGILSDARVLIENAQMKAQQHRLTYDSEIDILSVVKAICDLKQICTQSAGLRPFGVSILVAGVDSTGPKLFETDPTGIYFQYRASVIGEGETEIEEMLHKQYKESLTIEDGLKLTIKALAKVLDKNFDANRIDAAYIRTDDRKFKKFSKDRIEKLLKETKRFKK